jgi:nucleotide-binding universal stress UspA family protein
MFGTILLAVDGSPHADRAAELVRRLAGDGGDEVVVLHITEVMPMRGGVSVELHQDRDGMAAAKRHGSEVERAGVPVKVDLVRTLAGRVAPIIVETARACQAGVIVMGSHGRGDLTALLLGSVAHKVVHLADRPVLIVR